MMSTETRNIRDTVHNSARSGGNYGSLAKSTTQRIFYVVHNVERDDTLQRLALHYGISVQDIKRINKVWSDAELSLFEFIYIPINTSQLTLLRSKNPTLNIVQELPKSIDHRRSSSIHTNTTDETTSSLDSSTNSTFTTSTTITSSYQDYLSKIDQRIQSTKKNLQTIDSRDQHMNVESNEISASLMSKGDDNAKSCKDKPTATNNNERYTRASRLSDSSILSDLAMDNAREKYISAALERLQQERDSFYEL